METRMKAYAIGNLSRVVMGPPIVTYLERIDATLTPFGGRFLIHGGDKEVLEGNWSSDLIVIEFPDLDRARAWYASPAYQEIVSLRRDNADGAVILMEGVEKDHVATDILS
jgi:uncharacterized protein (DUF1330 family)